MIAGVGAVIVFPHASLITGNVGAKALVPHATVLAVATGPPNSIGAFFQTVIVWSILAL